jgi:hypothetical protein
MLLERLIVAQLVKKYPIFYGTRRFITLFKRTCKYTKSCLTYLKMLFWGGGLRVASPKLEDEPLLTIRVCLFSIIYSHLLFISEGRLLRPHLKDVLCTGDKEHM